MIIGFNKRFVPLIEDGSKIHTVRKDAAKRWKAGRTMHFATDVRKKNMKVFRTGDCKNTERIDIVWNEKKTDVSIKIGSKKLNKEKRLEFAKADGFATMEDFKSWFSEDFIDYKLIHWTEKKY
jgi:hypothetical protein